MMVRPESERLEESDQLSLEAYGSQEDEQDYEEDHGAEEYEGSSRGSLDYSLDSVDSYEKGTQGTLEDRIVIYHDLSQAIPSLKKRPKKIVASHVTKLAARVNFIKEEVVEFFTRTPDAEESPVVEGMGELRGKEDSYSRQKKLEDFLVDYKKIHDERKQDVRSVKAATSTATRNTEISLEDCAETLSKAKKDLVSLQELKENKARLSLMLEGCQVSLISAEDILGRIEEIQGLDQKILLVEQRYNRAFVFCERNKRGESFFKLALGFVVMLFSGRVLTNRLLGFR